MQAVRESNCRAWLPLGGLSVLLLLSGSVTAQQSVAENIMPVGHVCLAGQSCADNPPGAGTGTGVEPAAAVSLAPETGSASTTAAATVAAPAVASFDAAASYQQNCFACHASGAAGAPLLGDQEAWAARLDEGMEAVMINVINGLNAMPPRGLCIDCSDENLRAIVAYMLEQ